MREVYPEDYDYADTGCDLAPKCLSCPFTVCRYDMPFGIRALLREERAIREREMRDSGLSVAEIAVAMGLTRRTVQRDLR